MPYALPQQGYASLVQALASKIMKSSVDNAIYQSLLAQPIQATTLWHKARYSLLHFSQPNCLHSESEASFGGDDIVVNNPTNKGEYENSYEFS